MTRTSLRKGRPMAVGALSLILLLSTSAALVAASSRTRGAGALPASEIVAEAAAPPAEPDVPGAAPETARQPAHSRGPAARVETRISGLRKKLQITP